MQDYRVTKKARTWTPDKSPAGAGGLSEPKDKLALVSGNIQQYMTGEVFTIEREQLAMLEVAFRRGTYLRRGRRHKLAVMLGLPEHAIMEWFQNRRDRMRMEVEHPNAVSTESEIVDTMLQPEAPSASGPAAVHATFLNPWAYYPLWYSPYPAALLLPAFPLLDIEAPLLPPPQFCNIRPTHTQTYPTAPAMLPPVPAPLLTLPHHLYTPTTIVDALKLSEKPGKLFQPWL